MHPPALSRSRETENKVEVFLPSLLFAFFKSSYLFKQQGNGLGNGEECTLATLQATASVQLTVSAEV